MTSLVRPLLNSSALFHWARLPAYWGTLPRVAAALALQPGERLLDVGCGTGVGALLTREHYVGIDTDLAHLRFARGHGAEVVAQMSALALGFKEAAFDKAVLINMVHHLDDGVLDRLLAQLRRAVRSRIVVLDAAPDTANWVSRFLLAHDRGEHIRPRSELRTRLARHFDVEYEEAFHNTLRCVSQVLFTLRGTAGAPPAPAQ